MPSEPPVPPADIKALFPTALSACVATPEMYAAPLHPQEVDIAAAFNLGRRRDFAAGRASARAALAPWGLQASAIMRAPTRAPIWPPGFVGSIAHCEGLCCAVVSPVGLAAGLGLDVERAEPLEAQLVRYVCRPDEREACGGLAPPGGSNWAKVTFCAKEAIFKAYNPMMGAFLEFADVSVRFTTSDPHRGAFTARLTNLDRPGEHLFPQMFGRWAIHGSWCLAGVVSPPIADVARHPSSPPAHDRAVLLQTSKVPG